MDRTIGRRGFLRLAAAGVAGATFGVSMSGCGEDTDDAASSTGPATRRPQEVGEMPRILLAYFSRPGENYWNGGRRDLDVGNTEVLAGLIVERLDCEVHRIEAADPYSDNYDDTVARNVREQNANARPAMTNALDSIDGYETVLLASPIWNVRPPMIMSTFAERYDFTGKTVHPITTYAMSGLGTSAEDYARACRGGDIGPGLAMRGEDVRTGGPAAIDAWLRRIGHARDAPDRRGR